MKQYRYRITPEYLADTKGILPAPKTLQFEVGNHDDLFVIVERMRGRGDFNEHTATALAIGLKLFGTDLSVGAISYGQAERATAMETIMQEAHTHVQQAGVAHADETGHKERDIRQWM